jgi:hypothetical protein
LAAVGYHLGLAAPGRGWVFVGAQGAANVNGEVRRVVAQESVLGSDVAPEHDTVDHKARNLCDSTGDHDPNELHPTDGPLRPSPRGAI